jgi:hypothetical protein
LLLTRAEKPAYLRGGEGQGCKMRGMDAVVAALITIIVGGPIAYFLGNRRLRYERLYERRAEVIARLCELLAAVQRGVVDVTHPLQPSDVDRREQAKEAQRAFFELVHYYHSNEVWLEPDTCKKVETFMDNVHLTLGDYLDDLDERGYPQTPEGREQGLRILRDTQPLRRELIDEFRVILYPPPWYDAPLRFLERIPARNRKVNSDDAATREADNV